MSAGEIVATGEKTYVELGRKPKAVIAYCTGNLQLNWAWLENMGDKYIYSGGLRNMKYDSDFEVHSASPEMTITDTGFGLSYPYVSAGATYYYYAIY